MDVVEEFKYDRAGNLIGVKLPSKARVVATLMKLKGWEKSPAPPATLDERMRTLALEILGDLKAMGLTDDQAHKHMRDKFPVLYRRL